MALSSAAGRSRSSRPFALFHHNRQQFYKADAANLTFG
jgi:hypothetical protein